MRTTSLIAAGLLLAAVVPGWAQDETTPAGPSRFIDLDTDTVLPSRGNALRSDARVFGGHEDNNYVTLGARFGLSERLEGTLRGVFSSKRNTTAGNGSIIRHGGNDIEAMLKFRPAGTARIAGMIGVSLADTPAQSDPFLTLGAVATHSTNDSLELTLHPRAVLVQKNTIVGIGFGANARVAERLRMTAEYTPIVSGDNTRNTASGTLMKRDVYGLALHYSARGGSLDWSVGYTNSTGNTTGFSLTPGLGGSGAFFFAFAIRR